MSISIGSSGSNMSPRGAIRDFGKQQTGKAFDLRIVVRLLAYLRPYWLRMTIAITFVLMSAALTLSVPYLIKVAIDQSIANGDIAGLTQLALMLMAIFNAIYVMTAVLQYVLSWMGDQVLATLRGQLFRHLQDLPLGYHDTHIVGVTISRVIDDVAVINDLLSQGLITFVEDVFVLIGIIVVMLSLSLRLALITFTVLPLMILVTWLFARRAQVAFRQTRNRIAEVVGNLAENITGIRVIQAFAQEEPSQERFDEVNGANRDANVAAMTLSFLFLPAVEFLGMLVTVFVLWFGVRAVIENQLTLGVILAFPAYLTRYLDPPQARSGLHTARAPAVAGGER